MGSGMTGSLTAKIHAILGNRSVPSRERERVVWESQ